jgi:hypothetical protein
MNCYYHAADRPAVALCTNCNRALCTECAADVPNATACVNRCEAEVAAIKEVIERGKTGYQKAASAHARNAVIYLLMAIVMTVLGLLTLPTGWLMVGIGIVFLVGAGFGFSSSRKFQQVR